MKLGAFLAASDHMLVLYSPIYLRKLWTVFEVAAFLSLKPIEHMILLPLYKYVLLIGSLVVGFLYRAIVLICFTQTSSLYVSLIPAPFLAVGYVCCQRRWVKDREQILKAACDFRVADCVCFDENDRPLVYGNIAVLMEACGVVQQGAAEAEALDAFDRLVRTEVLSRMISCIGDWAYSYKELALLAFAISGGTLVDEPVRWHHHGEPKQLCSKLLFLAVWVFIWWPLIVVLTDNVAKRKPRLQGVHEVGWLCISTIVAQGLGTGMYAVTDVLLQRISGADSSTRF